MHSAAVRAMVVISDTHSCIDDFIILALSSAHVPSRLEPRGSGVGTGGGLGGHKEKISYCSHSSVMMCCGNSS